jgi:hypothetical protein
MPVGVGVLEDEFVGKGKVPHIGKGAYVGRYNSGLPVKVPVKGTFVPGPLYEVPEKTGLDLLECLTGHGLNFLIPESAVGGHEDNFTFNISNFKYNRYKVPFFLFKEAIWVSGFVLKHCYAFRKLFLERSQ